MKCTNHNEKDAIGVCIICGKPYCEDCLILKENKYLCLEDAKTKKKNYHPLLAFLLNLFPGFGYLYLGLYKTGLMLFLIFVGLISLNDEDCPICGLAIAFTIGYSAIDGWRKAKFGNISEENLEEKTKSKFYLGAILFFIGIFLLLSKVWNVDISYLLRYWPLILIIIGIYQIYKHLKK